MRRHPRRAAVNPNYPEGWATSDRNGHVGNLKNMKWQHDWRGSHLINTRVLVHEDELDVPQRQLGTLELPPDPIPVPNARPENYAADQQPVSTRYTIDKFGNLGPTRKLLSPSGAISADIIPSQRIVSTPGNLSSKGIAIAGPPPPPHGFVYLLGADGKYLTASDGSFLLGIAP